MGGIGINAVRVLIGTLADVDVTKVACWMTAGVSGWVSVLLSSVAGVMRS